MPAGNENTEESEDRNVVNGENYALRAACTISFDEQPRYTVPAYNENTATTAKECLLYAK